MSTVLDRPRSQDASTLGAAGPRLQLWSRGALAAISAVVVSLAVVLVLVLVAWAADPRSGASAGAATRVGVALWLLAVRGPLSVPGGVVALPPLTLTLVIGWMLARSAGSLLGWWTEERDPGGRGADDVLTTPAAVAEVVAAVAVPFAVACCGLAFVPRSDGLHPSPGLAFLTALVVGVVAGLAGSRGSGWTERLPRLRPPVAVAAGLQAAVRAAAVILAGAALTLLAGVAWHLGRAMTLAGSTGGGVAGAIGVSVVCVLLLPNAVLATVGYLAGAGVSLGTGSEIGLSGGHAAVLPPLPLLAAVPQASAPVDVRIALVLLLAAAGIVAGWSASRRLEAMRDLLIAALVAAAGCALALGVAVTVAGGPAGPGRLATVGASGWRTGLLLLAELAAVAVVTAVAVGSWRTYAHRDR